MLCFVIRPLRIAPGVCGGNPNDWRAIGTPSPRERRAHRRHTPPDRCRHGLIVRDLASGCRLPPPAVRRASEPQGHRRRDAVRLDAMDRQTPLGRAGMAGAPGDRSGCAGRSPMPPAPVPMWREALQSRVAFPPAQAG